MEFTEPSLVAQALVLNDSLFKGRNLKVCKVPLPDVHMQYADTILQVVPKRTNVPGMTRGRGRGGMRGGGRGFRGGFAPRASYRGGYRGRGGRGYAPY